MIIELEFKVKPISANHYRKKSKRGDYKTPEAIAFDSMINSQMIKQRNIYRKFNSVYDRNKHYLCIELVFRYPFMTKQNIISMTAGDYDNFIKNTQDQIFKHLTPDDSAILNANITKVNSSSPSISAKITIKSLDQIR